jgi:serine/threonine-protein kinase RsbW
MDPLESKRFPATLDSLAPLRNLVKQSAAASGLDAKVTYGLTLAVDEIATNIIVHGYEEAGLSGSLDVRCEKEGGRLRVVLEDDGAPFDPRSCTLPTDCALSQPLEQRTVGGLGLFLAVQGVDRFDYLRRDDRNVNIFEVNLPPGT